MRRGRIFIYLALIVILGVAGFLLVGQRLLKKPAKPAEGTPALATQAPAVTVNVVFVAQDVPRGTQIQETYLTMLPYPRDLVTEGMYTDMGEVVGRIARYDLKPNVVLTSGMLAEKTEPLAPTGSVYSLLIPNKYVAISIPITRLSSVSYGPQKGDHVNVIVSVLLVDLDTDFQSALPNQTAAVLAPGPSVTTEEQIKNITAQIASGGVVASLGRSVQDPLLEQTFYLVASERQRPRLVSQTLIQNVVVLQVGNFPLEREQAPIIGVNQPTPTPQPQEQQAQVTAPVTPDVITLIVTPQDAVTLNYLVFSGAKLTLALRPPSDDSLAQTQAVTLDFLFSEYKITLPVKLPYGMEPRTDQLVSPQLITFVLKTTPK